MDTQNNSSECFLGYLSRYEADVKKFADYVTKSNNEDGVVYAIENFIKKI